VSAWRLSVPLQQLEQQEQARLLAQQESVLEAGHPQLGPQEWVVQTTQPVQERQEER
jgi:hypothetical protein